MTADDPGQRQRRQRQAERIHGLGPRALAELLDALRGGAEIEAAVTRFADLTPDQIEAAGADGFPPSIWRAA